MREYKEYFDSYRKVIDSIISDLERSASAGGEIDFVLLDSQGVIDGLPLVRNVDRECFVELKSFRAKPSAVFISVDGDSIPAEILSIEDYEEIVDAVCSWELTR